MMHCFVLVLGVLAHVQAQRSVFPQDTADRARPLPPVARRALVNGRWFDGHQFRPDTFYIVQGILTRTRPDSIDRVVNLHGGYVVPPFGEAHNHNVESVRNIDTVVARYLRDGVFYVANPNNIRELSEQLTGRINTPTSIDVTFANAGLTATGGHPSVLYDHMLRHERYRPAVGELPAGWFAGRAYVTIDQASDLRRAWPGIIAGRPDLIKTYLVHTEQTKDRSRVDRHRRFGLNPTLLPEIVRRAHRDARRVAVHVETAEDFRIAVRSGADIIGHVPGWLAWNRDDARAARLTEADARAAARAKVTVVTTTISAAHMHGADTLVARQVLLENLRLLQKHGVALAIGSDHAHTSLDEVMHLHAMGIFDNRTLLRLWCEITPRMIFPHRAIGQLREGAEASFLVLVGDPIADFQQVRRITLRFKQGHMLGDDTRTF